eukprot:TCONS_00028327-protein
MSMATILRIAMTVMITKYHFVSTGMPPGGFFPPPGGDTTKTTSTTTTTDAPPTVKTTLSSPIRYNDTVTGIDLLGGGGPGEDDGVPNWDNVGGNRGTATDGEMTRYGGENNANAKGYSSSAADMKLGNFRFYIGLVSSWFLVSGLLSM